MRRRLQQLFAISRYFALFLFGASAVSSVAAGDSSTTLAALGPWVRNQQTHAIDRLVENISPPGTVPGVVVASPSKKDPDYFYHWIRDAALMMDVVVDQYRIAANGSPKKHQYEQILLDYVRFSRSNQTTPNPSGSLGEPKFLVDGSAFWGPWGRPQNDGPALRAIALTRLAMQWLAEGKASMVRDHLYQAELPANTVIKADLEFVSHRWRESSFDLWEEVRGHHFYTRMVQRRALLEGADLANTLGDGGAAGWYRQQARLLEDEISRHWTQRKGIITATLDRDGGIHYKDSGLDAAIVLGALHGGARDGFFGVSNEKVLATVKALKQAFYDLYPINKNGLRGVAIGRYPEDKYDGYTTSTEGNPWFLLTTAFAEFYFRLAEEHLRSGTIEISTTNLGFYTDLGISGLSAGEKLTNKQPLFARIVDVLKQEGDAYLERVRYHCPDGRFSEQLNRHSGYKQGAPDLTWSYGALVTALSAREKLSANRGH